MAMLDALVTASADEYRTRAAELRAKARFAEDRELAAEWMDLAAGYIRLAGQADPTGDLE
jgi:hypothetical protein